MLLDFFPWKTYFPVIFDFHFCENPCFHNEFQALSIASVSCTIKGPASLKVWEKLTEDIKVVGGDLKKKF